MIAIAPQRVVSTGQADAPVVELGHQHADQFMMVHQREVPSVEQVHLRLEEVAQLGQGAGGGEEDVPFAPRDEGAWSGSRRM